MKFTGGKDTDRYFLESLDDKELFTAMQTNKEYLKLGQDFFEKRMKKRYPILAARKPEDVTWFKYYINNVFYISKLKEDYNLDYYNVPSFYPKTIYHRLYYADSYSIDEEKSKCIILFLTESGEYEKAGKYIEDLSIDPYVKEILKFFLLSQLLKDGNIDLFEKTAKEYGIFPPYEELVLIEGASQSGKEEIIDYIISRSNLIPGKIFHAGIDAAVISGKLDIIDYFIKKYPRKEIDWYLSDDSVGGENLNIFKILLKKDLENAEKRKQFLGLMRKYIIISIIKEGKLDFLKHAIEMYKAYGGDMKALVKHIVKTFKPSKIIDIDDYMASSKSIRNEKKVPDRDIRRYLARDLKKMI